MELITSLDECTSILEARPNFTPLAGPMQQGSCSQTLATVPTHLQLLSRPSDSLWLWNTEVIRSRRPPLNYILATWIYFTSLHYVPNFVSLPFHLVSPSSDGQSRDSSVGIALGYELDDRDSRVRFPAGAGNFSLHHRVQNGSGAHPASHTLGTRGAFPGGKAAGAWSWPLTSM
jgi:hypothetical protein